MIRAVIFDLGGVLTTSPVTRIREWAAARDLPYDRIQPVMAAEDGLWSRFETSELDERAFASAFEEHCAGHGFTVDGTEFLAAFLSGLTVREEMVAVVRHLRGRYRLAAITNNVVRGGRREPAQVPWEDLFELVVESSKLGIRKPDPRIYLHTCEQLAVRPEEAVFLDDLGANLKPARALGMTTIKVDDPLAAIEELEAALGIALPRS